MRPNLRVGLLIPASNTVMEVDLQRALREHATVHTARMRLDEPMTTAGELLMLDRYAEPAASEIGCIDPDLVIFGCTSAGALRGRAGDEELRQALSGLTRSPVIGVLDAMSSSLRRRGARRVALLTPYPEDMSRPIADGLESDGFDVLELEMLGIVSNREVGQVEPMQIAEAAQLLAERVPAADAIAIGCSNFRALEIRGRLEEECSKAVVTANSAVVDLALEALGNC